MKQKQLVQERLKRLEKINDSVNKVRRKISGRNDLSEQENFEKIERILFETSDSQKSTSQLKNTLKMLEHNNTYQRIDLKDQNEKQFQKQASDTKFNSLPDLSSKSKIQMSFGCIVSSKNGIYKKSNWRRQPDTEANVLDKKNLNDAFQTVRSMNIATYPYNSSQRDLSVKDVNEEKDIVLNQEIYIQSQIQIHKENERSSFKDQIYLSVEQTPAQTNDDGIANYLLDEKQRLEEEIAELDSQLGKFKVTKKVVQQVKKQGNWCQDRENFEYQWLQLENTKNVDIISWQTLDQDLFDMLAEAEQTQQKDVEPQIDRRVIDNLAKEVEELMVLNNLNSNDQQQLQSVKRTYNPPLDVIEEEVELSFLI